MSDLKVADVRVIDGSKGIDSLPLVPSLAPTRAERSLAEALMRCVARWGISKTTIEDIAREAGVSRATVYRHFPGGKTAILELAWSLEVGELIERVLIHVNQAQTLEDALVSGIHLAASHLGGHPGLTFMRNHEPAEFEQLIAFDHLDDILVSSAEVMAPLLERFLPLDLARQAVMWAARLLVSYLGLPADYLDITSESDVRMLVQLIVIPGVERMSATPVTSTSNS